MLLAAPRPGPRPGPGPQPGPLLLLLLLGRLRGGWVLDVAAGGSGRIGLRHPFSHQTRAYANLCSPEVEARKRNIVALGLATNLSFAVSKTALGLQCGSPALVSDGIHAASDAVSDVIALGSLSLAKRRPNAAMPFGYGHFDTLGSLMLGVSLVGAGGASALLAFQDLIQIAAKGEGSATTAAAAAAAATTAAAAAAGTTPDATLVSSLLRDFGGELIAGTMIGSILVKEWLFRLSYKLGKQSRSPVIVANAWHHRTDSLSSVVAGIGIAGAAYGMPMLDPVCALLVSGWIIRSGIDVAWENIGDLTDRQTSHDHREVSRTIKMLAEKLSKTTEIVGTHDIHLRRMGSIRIIDLHAVVDPKLSVTASYQAGQRLRRAIMEELPEISDVFVHVDAGEHAFLEASSPALHPESTIATADQAANGGGEEAKLPKSHYQLEAEVRKRLLEVRRALPSCCFLGVSHINVHYVTQGRGIPVRAVIEVNLLIDPTRPLVTFAELESTGEMVREAIMRISDVDSVDLHVQLSPGGDEGGVSSSI